MKINIASILANRKEAKSSNCIQHAPQYINNFIIEHFLKQNDFAGIREIATALNQSVANTQRLLFKLERNNRIGVFKADTRKGRPVHVYFLARPQ